MEKQGLISVRVNVWNSVWPRAANQVWNQVSDQVWNRARNQVTGQVPDYVHTLSHTTGWRNPAYFPPRKREP